MSSHLGSNLIFIISQPRAGSTMLQRMLGSHPSIYTVSEPWLMLNPLYALKPNGYQAEYNARWAREALRVFRQTLPDGEDDYIEGIRRMSNYLYERALANSGKSYFLDKTPRYYLVIPELYRVFPEARYIILFRNPLAVLCSVLNTWVRGNWFALYKWKADLIRAPHLLIEGAEILKEQCAVAQYEELVSVPETTLKQLCDHLDMDFLPDMVNYGQKGLDHFQYGDQKEVYQHVRPAPQNADRWIQALEKPKVWHLTRDYLQLLGVETIEQMGYSYEDLQQQIELHRPNGISVSLTFSLNWLLSKSEKDRRKWEYGVMLLSRSFLKRCFQFAAGRFIHLTGRKLGTIRDGIVRYWRGRG